MTASNSPPRKYTFVSPSPVARRLFWHVLGIGCTRLETPRRFEAQDKPGGVLMWIESGSGQLKLGATEYQLERGSRFWLFRLGQPRLFLPAQGSTLPVQSIRFAGPTLDSLLDALGVTQSPQFLLSPSLAASVCQTQRKILRLVTGRPANWEWEVHIAVTFLLEKFLAARKVLSQDPRHLPEPIPRTLDTVASDPHRDWKARELAANAGMNYSSFRILFRRHMHETIHEHLQRTRLDHAQVLLSDERLQIKDIARQLHFANEFYFSRFFHNKSGMSPSEFRKQAGISKDST